MMPPPTAGGGGVGGGMRRQPRQAEAQQPRPARLTDKVCGGDEGRAALRRQDGDTRDGRGAAPQGAQRAVRRRARDGVLRLAARRGAGRRSVALARSGSRGLHGGRVGRGEARAAEGARRAAPDGRDAGGLGGVDGDAGQALALQELRELAAAREGARLVQHLDRVVCEVVLWQGGGGRSRVR